MPVIYVRETSEAVELRLPFSTMQLARLDGHFNGVWHQGEASFPVALKPVQEFPLKRRPQSPVKPLPYREEALAIPSVDGVTLGATLSLPNDVAHPNVVILVHGSGPSNRNGSVAGHHPFAVLADYLTRHGVAVLRYDKRGISRSTGDYEHHTQPQLVDDLWAVVHAMKGRKEFNRLGLIGLSEGPMIAAAVAARHPQSVDFLVSMAGVGLPGIDLIQLQDRMVARDNGASPQGVERLMSYVRHFYETVVAHADPGERVTALKALHQNLSAEDKALVEKYKMNEGTLSLRMAATPALRVLLMSDAQTAWRGVRCPVLALNGSLDHQVPPESLDGIVAALHEGGNKQVESTVMPSLNHLFQSARTGATDEYSALDETMAPVVMQRIEAFARKQR